MTTWLECSTLAAAEAVDAVAELFGRVGQGVAIEEPISSSADGERVEVIAGQPVLVKTYLPLDERADERRRQLEEGSWHLGRLRQVEAPRFHTLDESDWADAWKKHFFVQRVGERIVIVPSWRQHEPQPGDLAIQLDPGMAFGTGLHPTTRLCLQTLEHRVRGGESALDLGTGSGILAIAAARLGAGRVLALDVEPVAARVAAENVAINGLAEQIETRQGELLEAAGQRFELVVANISLRVLTELRSELLKVLSEGGLAVLSGLLAESAGKLAADLEAAGWRLLEQREDAEWALLVVTRA